MKRRGKFITFEGVEGSGKTTQASLLCDYLRGHDIDVVETREPGGTGLGEKIRQVLLAPAESPPVPTAELLLFLAARAQIVAEVIRPALEAGKWVVCDRFFDATLAYQGYGRGIDTQAIHSLNEVATDGLEPDLTILLDLDIDTGIKRAVEGKREFHEGDNGDRMENEDREFHKRVRQGYLQLVNERADRIKLVPVTDSIEKVREFVVLLIEPFLAKA